MGQDGKRIGHETPKEDWKFYSAVGATSSLQDSWHKTKVARISGAPILSPRPGSRSGRLHNFTLFQALMAYDLELSPFLLTTWTGFEGFLNQTAPFTPAEHKVEYKTSRQYADFSFGSNNYKPQCTYPRFWNGSGQRVLKGSGSGDGFDDLSGCYDSDFDQVCSTESISLIF